MNSEIKHSSPLLFRVGTALLLAALALTCPAQTPSLASPKNPLYPKNFLVPVDKSHAGQHRALAMLAYLLHEKGDGPTAATVARILECEWDRVEVALKTSSPMLYKEIDDAMDDFIRPIITYASVKPDPAKLKTSYDTYLASLAKITD
jgi:hypothetical protein